MKIDAQGRPHVPWWLDCHRCLGKGCSACEEKGVIPMSLCAECIDSPSVAFYYKAYHWTEKGHLCLPGSWPDQPNKVMESHELIGKMIRYFNNKRKTTANNVSVTVVERKGAAPGKRRRR